MRRTAAVGSFFALVTGCGNPAPVQAPAPPASTTVAAPQSQARPQPQFEWMGGHRGERGGLSYGVPETDAISISMECDRGSRSVRTSAADRLSAGVRLVIGSGDTRSELGASPIHDSLIDDSIYAVANVPVNDPALQAFRASGEMWVWDDSYVMRAETDAERQMIEEFFHFCDAN